MVPTSAITKIGNRNVVMVPNDPTTVTVAPSFSGYNYAGFASSTASTTVGYMASSTASSTRIRGNGGGRTFGTTGASQAAQATTATVHAVFVTVGISSATNTEIVSGLNEGDIIVTRTITGTTSGTAATTARTGSIFGIGGGGAGAVRTGGGGGRIGG